MLLRRGGGRKQADKQAISWKLLFISVVTESIKQKPKQLFPTLLEGHMQAGSWFVTSTITQGPTPLNAAISQVYESVF